MLEAMRHPIIRKRQENTLSGVINFFTFYLKKVMVAMGRPIIKKQTRQIQAILKESSQLSKALNKFILQAVLAILKESSQLLKSLNKVIVYLTAKMINKFLTPYFLVTVLLAGVSFLLIYKEKFEVGLAGVGVSVALAMASPENKGKAREEEKKLLLMAEVENRKFIRDNTMTESDKMPEKKSEPNIVMNFHGSVSGVAGTVQGDQIINNRQDLAESMIEIQRLWEQFEKNNNVNLSQEEEAQIQAALVEINQNPKLRERFFSALKSGSIEALKEVFNNPAVNISVAFYEGWTNP